jgi:thiol-disulfide isomerase/thioredoxin
LIAIAFAWSELYAKPVPTEITPSEFVLFEDYREISPGVWLPFRETRTFPHASQTVQGKRLLRRSELVVEEVRTDLNLADRCTKLLPTEGDHVQDQRFIVPIDYEYGGRFSDDNEIRKLAQAQYSKMLEGQEFINRLTGPIAAMAGKPAPALPAVGWVGGRPPAVTGKPYLLHFWATWRSACEDDFPRLRTLAAKGATVLGMHPPGTSSDEILKVTRDQKLGYPTLLAGPEGNHVNRVTIGGYPAGLFPYCIVVDAQGRVAAHGSLADVLRASGVRALLAAPQADTKMNRSPAPSN